MMKENNSSQLVRTIWSENKVQESKRRGQERSHIFAAKPERQEAECICWQLVWLPHLSKMLVSRTN